MSCPWCAFNDELRTLKRYAHWRLVLAESQHLLGWSHAVLHRHAERFEELTDEELLELRTVVADWKRALAPFAPHWHNEAHLGNIDRHFHVQLIPRYREPFKHEGRIFSDPTYGKMARDEWHPEERQFLVRLAAELRPNLEGV